MISQERLTVSVVFFAVLLFLLLSSNPLKASESVSESIKEAVEDFSETDGLWIGCEKIYAGKELIDYYRKRFFRPIWVTERGPSSLGRELADTIFESEAHGLTPEDYHFLCIKEWLKSMEDRLGRGADIYSKELAGLDILLTDAFLNFGSHLADGKVDPEKIYPEWLSEKEHKADVFQALNHIEDNGSVSSALKKLAPPHSDYWGLVRAARWLKDVGNAGGWPIVTGGRKMNPGDRDHRVVNLRKRLEIEGYLPHGMESDQDFYDERLQEAVKKFQADNGLEVDGIVGKNTIRELNVTPEKRRQQIIVNLERWRWLPRFLGKRHIRVNTASFQLEAVDDDRIELQMRVIVGKDFQKTPVFTKKMKYMEINPYWNVPKSILKDELIPRFKADPEALIRDHFEIVSGWSEDSPVVDPATIDWSTIHSANFPGRVRQKPGPWNSLGRIKFMFPNQFNVYLHDTPSRNLFRKAHRALSHGCIRLEKPVELALFVLQDDPAWDRKKIKNTIREGSRTIVGVPGEFIVHLMYFTAWMEENGEIHFRRDIYQRDDVLWKALNTFANGAGALTAFDGFYLEKGM